MRVDLFEIAYEDGVWFALTENYNWEDRVLVLVFIIGFSLTELSVSFKFGVWTT